MMTRRRARFWPRSGAADRHARPFVGVLIGLLLMLSASGCATLDRTDVRLASAKTVGIVSAIGDDFTFTRAGLTAPTEADQHFSIAAWGLDDLVTIRIGLLLGKRYQVEGLTYSRAPFAAKEAVSPFAMSNAVSKLTSGSENRLSELVRTQVAPQGLDVYVIVTKATAPYGSRSRTVAGIGAIERVAVLGSSGQLHALYAITVIDGHTFKVIGKKQAGPLEGDELFRLKGPSREIDADLLSAAGSPTGGQELKAAVVDLIDRGLPKTLRDLQLIDQPKP
jgi:hypothetical protein